MMDACGWMHEGWIDEGWMDEGWMDLTITAVLKPDPLASYHHHALRINDIYIYCIYASLVRSEVCFVCRLMLLTDTTVGGGCGVILVYYYFLFY